MSFGLDSSQRPHTVADFQTMFEHIYGEANRRGYDDGELIRRLMEEISGAMELARKDRREQFAPQLANIFSWYNAVANRFAIDLQEALWKKYPGACSYCLKEADCVCGLEHPSVSVEDKERSLNRLRSMQTGRPTTLREHQDLHARLYKRQNERIMLIQTVAHLGEEAGEVSRAFRHAQRPGGDAEAFHKAEMEMADIASWLFATATRLSLFIDDVVWDRFPYQCDICLSGRCACEVMP